MAPSLEITPSTKVAELLEAHPQLEEELIALAPAFRALRNPVLRRTVARVTTLAKAAGVGGVDPVGLVDRLRAAVGQPPLGGSGIAAREAGPAPDWVAGAESVAEIDADALLERGENPLTVVGARARELGPGEILRVRASFRPVPLMEALEKQGLESWPLGDEGCLVRRPTFA